jgi:hypothetical protein
LGGGVITGGKILQGAMGIATELGHIVLDDNGPHCGCGKDGHLEAFSSGTGIHNYVCQKIKEGVHTSLKSESPALKKSQRLPKRVMRYRSRHSNEPVITWESPLPTIYIFSIHPVSSSEAASHKAAT